MIYYQDEHICVRDLTREDARAIVAGELAQGWEGASMDKYEMRLRDAAEGRSTALVALWDGNPAGYINLYKDSRRGSMSGRNLPEIVDFGVLEKYRRRGIGSKLMDAAEALAARHAGEVCLGVGLHSGYGSAQRLYVKRGYLPDGTGAWYGDHICPPYSECKNDDSLSLCMSRRLPAELRAESCGASVREVVDAQERTSIARAILEALTDWFEVTETREAYIAQSAEQVFFAAEADGAPVGFLCLKPTGDKTVELAVMGVLSGAHGRGIGTALFAAAKDRARAMGFRFMQVKTVKMGCYPDYDATNRFYQSLGFSEFEVMPDLWDEANPCQIYVMAL